MNKTLRLTLLIALAFVVNHVRGQKDVPVSVGPADATHAGISEKSKALKSHWFTDARFGMFIQWGVYAIPARGEWVITVSLNKIFRVVQSSVPGKHA